MHDRTINVTVAPSQRLCRALAAFGLGVRRVEPGTPPPPPSDQLAARVLDALAPGRIALLTGPSGSGKSTLLREAAMLASRRGWTVLRVAPRWAGRRAAVIDLIGGPLGEAIALLVRAGLGEPALLGRTPAELSEGERARLMLAWAMREAQARGPGVILFADEFGAVLDRVTARGLARSLARWALRERCRVVVATGHEDLAAALDPGVTVTLALGGGTPTLTEGGPYGAA